MGKKRHSTEQIISKLGEAEVELAKGQNVGQMCKKLAVTYRWRKEYGGLRMDQAKRLKELEKENARLKKLVAEAELDLVSWRKKNGRCFAAAGEAGEGTRTLNIQLGSLTSGQRNEPRKLFIPGCLRR